MRKSYFNWLSLCIILIGVSFRLVNIYSPILGVHSWRQADTAAMARHFFLSGKPIWLPQIDWAGASAGFVESEFPIFPFLTASFYKFFGIYEFFGRGLSVLFSAITIYLLIRLGARLFDPISGLFSGLFFAIIPLGVYYGRTFQAESLMLMLGILSIDQSLAWRRRGKGINLFISWLTFCLACLIKVLPLIWLGLPILISQLQDNNFLLPVSIKQLRKRFINLSYSFWFWLYLISLLLAISLWYSYAYHLGQESGLSFGFWGKSSDRSSFLMLFDLRTWLDLFIRFSLRGLAIFGLPILIIGIFKARQSSGGQIFLSGIIATLGCTLIALRSSSVHEYYQLPLLLFSCPIMGLGSKTILASTILKNNQLEWITRIFLVLIISISLSILHFDYWSIEKGQTKIWMPLAERIRLEVPEGSRIISVTGNDPTLLNLARRQGWLTSFHNVNSASIESWLNEGATHIAGSWDWEETYNSFSDTSQINRLQELLCNTKDLQNCINEPLRFYLIPIEDVSR